MKETITYEEAQKAKRVLVEYLKNDIDWVGGVGCLENHRRRTELLVYMALTQTYFLD